MSLKNKKNRASHTISGAFHVFFSSWDEGRSPFLLGRGRPPKENVPGFSICPIIGSISVLDFVEFLIQSLGKRVCKSWRMAMNEMNKIQITFVWRYDNDINPIWCCEKTPNQKFPHQGLPPRVKISNTSNQSVRLMKSLWENRKKLSPNHPTNAIPSKPLPNSLKRHSNSPHPYNKAHSKTKRPEMI